MAICLASGVMTACGDDSSSSAKSSIVPVSVAETENTASDNSIADSSEAGENPDSSEAEEVTEAETEAETEPETEAVELSDELFDCQISVGGKVISLPCSLEGLYDAGWTKTENGGSYTSIKLDGSCISVSADKKDGDTVKILQCYYGFNDAEAILAKGITIGKSTREEVEAAYGEPSELAGTDFGDPNFKYCEYDANGEVSKYVIFRFDGGTKDGYESGNLWGVEICCEK